MTRTIVFALLLAAIGLLLACGQSETKTKVIKSAPAGNNLTVAFGTSDGVLRNGKQELTLTFADASGKPVDVGAASLNFFMPAMGSMAAMNSAAALTTTSTPGVYTGKVDIEMSGEWQAQIKYEGPSGKGAVNIVVTAQ